MNSRELIDRQELEQAALLGELARPMTHECNNFLNTLLLQIAVMQNELSASFASELTMIEQESRKLAKLIHEWQNYRVPPSNPRNATALGEVVQSAMEDLVQFGQATPDLLEWKPAPGIDKVAGSRGKIRSLCYLLLQLAVTRRDAGTVAAKTGRTGSTVTLEIVAQGDWWPDSSNLELGAQAPALSLAVMTCISLIKATRGLITVVRTNQECKVSIDFGLAD